MKITLVAIVLTLSVSGCQSTPTPAPAPSNPWIDGFADIARANEKVMNLPTKLDTSEGEINDEEEQKRKKK